MRAIVKEYIESTKVEIKALQDAGMELLSFEEYDKLIKSFGLELDLDPRSTLHCYYNNLNYDRGSWLEATCTPVDKDGIGWCNVKGKWYQENVVFDTELYQEFKKFRNKYFTLFRNNYIMSI